MSEEKIITTQSCIVTGEEFDVTDKDIEFYNQVSPVLGGQRYDIPMPRRSPYERMINKYAFRNERALFKRKCDLTGKEILSMFYPDLPHTVYGMKEWWSDDWSWADYGVKPDWDKSFSDQFQSLLETAPLLSLSMLMVENSDYNNCAGNLKDCYLCFDVDYLEHCYYVGNSMRCEHCFDCDVMVNCQFCHSCFNCTESRNLINSVDCRSSHDLLFCYGCTGSSDCLFCFNQYRKTHCIYNEQYTPEEYEKKKKQILESADWDELKSFFYKKRYDYPHKYYHGFHNENSTGDYLYHSKNAQNCFACHEVEDCKNCVYLFDSKNCHDHIIFGDHSQFTYQCIATGINVNTSAFNWMCWDNVKSTYYSVLAVSSQDCFGCVSVKKARNTFLNTAYGRHEYEQLVAKMITHMTQTGEWGEFFPMSMSPYGYNETVGMDYTPLSKEEVIQRGGHWIERDVLTQEDGGYQPLPISQYQEISVGAEIAKRHIDECLDAVLVCRATKRPFKIQPKELAYLIENGIPIPRIHPEERHKKRDRRYRAGLRLYDGVCSKTGVSFQTPYHNTGDQKVTLLSEDSFQKEVY